MDKEILYRNTSVEGGPINEEERTVEVCFSSEAPVERAFGNEILDHSPDSVNLLRMSQKAPLLLEHNPEKQIGVIEKAWIDDDRKGRAIVRFSKSALGSEIFQDVLDGCRNWLSCGYTVSRFIRESVEGSDTFRAVDWMPMECSIVGSPADLNCHVGRSYVEERMTDTTSKEKLMEDQNKESHEETIEVRHEEPKVKIEVRPDRRAQQIAELGEKFNAQSDAIGFISENRSVDSFKDFLMERNQNEPLESLQGDDQIGLSNNERKNYSLVRAIEEHARNGKLSGLELEAHDELEKRFNRPANGFYVPNDVLHSRDISTDSSTTGDKLIATELGDLIEPLRPELLIDKLGMRVLTGLSSNVSIPKAGSTTAYWVSENAAPTESQPTLGNITLSPKRVSATTDISKTLIAQSSIGVEQMIREDILHNISKAISKAAIKGGGSGEPNGVFDDSDLNAVALAGSAPTWAEIVEGEEKIMTDNALVGDIKLVATPSFMSAMKTTEKASNTAQFIWSESNTVNSYPAFSSSLLPADSALMGAFSNVIVGYFGAGADVTSDPYSLSRENMIRLVATTLCDVGVRHGQAFCKIS